LSAPDGAEFGDGLATSVGAWAAGLVCGCCELAGITAKSPITRVAATKVRMESPIYFLTSFNDHNSEQQVGADLLRLVVPN
jgi:hypothetical protein